MIALSLRIRPALPAPTSVSRSPYLHGSMERQQMIADAISEQARHQMTSHHKTGSGQPGTESGM